MTDDEKDRLTIAEAGPWKLVRYSWAIEPNNTSDISSIDAVAALLRIIKRITRQERRKAKKVKR